MFKVVLGIILGLASFGCSIYIIVEMFKDAVWKGIVGLLCFLYAWYYAIFEFEHEWKWPIALVAIFGGGSSFGILF